MELKKILVPAGSALLVAAGYRAWGWGGVTFAVGGLLLWLLLHYSRLMHVLKRAAERPIGYLDSAVMLNAKLKTGLSLLHVMALTRALGEQLSPKDREPEIFRWTDASDASVICEFLHGKLVRWELKRPPTGALEGVATSSSPAP
jgi:hypothetical protein